MSTTGTSIWEAVAGRAPGRPVGPADRDLYEAVVERLNPAKARPLFRDGVEEAHLTSLRGQPYVMLRSPGPKAAYVRLHPEEVALAHLMDGRHSVAALVSEFAKITGRLAPGQVLRVVADLAGNRMLGELPVDAFRSVEALRRRPLPLRFGRWLLAVAKGQRFELLDVDRLAAALYRLGGRLFFTRPAGVLLVVAALAGGGVFLAEWARGAKQVFLVNGSYAAGGLALLGLNAVCLMAHELGHALAAKHAGRRVPAAGILMYFGIPSVFVDTTDVWMAGRRARLLTSAAGPGASLAMAGAMNLVGLAFPGFAPLAFKLSFLWYLNALFNLNPLLSLDGYYLLMDWLEIPNLRARGLATFVGNLRRRRLGWQGLAGEDRLVTMYGTAAGLWILISIFLGIRIWKDRVSGLVAGLWYGGWPSRIGLVMFVAVLVHPLVYLGGRRVARAVGRARRRLAERRRQADEPRRLEALAASALRGLSVQSLQAMVRDAKWWRPRTATAVIRQGAPPPGVLVVVHGFLEARRDADPSGSVRGRATAGELAGAAATLRGVESPLTWTAVDAVLLVIPAAAFLAAVGDVAGRVGPEAAEAHGLLELPVFASLTEADRSAMLADMRAVDLEPEQAVQLEGPGRAIVVAAGIVRLADGHERLVGGLVGPPSEGATIVATARTRARVWSVPAAAGLAVGLAGGGGLRPPLGGKAGVHAGGDLPITAPWGPPPAAGDGGRADRRLARSFRRLLVLLLLLALLSLLVAVEPGAAWSEVPGQRLVVSAARGRVDVLVGDRASTLRPGARAAVGQGASIKVRNGSVARLTFRGGGQAVLCPGSKVVVDLIRTPGPEPREPVGALSLRSGKIVVDTRSRSTAFEPVALRVDAAGRRVASTGVARFAATTRTVQVAGGAVTVDGTTVPPSKGGPSCGVPQRAAAAGAPLDGITAAPPGPSPSLPSSPSPSAGPSSSLVPSPSQGGPAPARGDGTILPPGAPSPSSQPSPPPDVRAPGPAPTANPTPDPTPDPTPAPVAGPGPAPTPAPRPDFRVSCSPSTLQATPGRASSSACTVTSIDGFSDPVSLACSVESSVGSCLFDRASVTPPPNESATSTLIMKVASSAQPGCYRLTVEGSRRPLTRTATLLVDVLDARGGSSC